MKYHITAFVAIFFGVFLAEFVSGYFFVHVQASDIQLLSERVQSMERLLGEISAKANHNAVQIENLTEALGKDGAL